MAVQVLVSLLGGGLLAAATGPTIHQETQLITHTRSFLTTATTQDTLVIPVQFRGSQVHPTAQKFQVYRDKTSVLLQILQTVTDVRTVTTSSTTTSVQTLLNYQPAPPPVR